MSDQRPTIDYRARGTRESRGWRHSVLDANAKLWLLGMVLCMIAILAIVVSHFVPDEIRALELHFFPGQRG